jgi:hypothetical protein
MRRALTSWVARVDGEPVEVIAGMTRVAPDHPLCSRWPERWGPDEDRAPLTAERILAALAEREREWRSAS